MGFEGIMMIRKVSQKSLDFFTKQMYVMLRSGVPTIESLSLVIKHEKNEALKKIIAHLIIDLKNGSSLSASLKNFPKVFNSLYIQMIISGEMGVGLDKAFKLISLYRERKHRFYHKIKSASIYPLILSLCIGLIISLMLLLVIPRFEILYQQILDDSELPVITRLIMNCSHFLTLHIHWIFLVCILTTLFIKWIFKKSLIHEIIDPYILLVPLLGEFMKNKHYALYMRSLSSLLNARVDLLDAMKISRRIVDNHSIVNELKSIELRIEEGESLSRSISQSKIFSDLTITVIHIGEETASLNERLIELADKYEEDMDDFISKVLLLLEPSMILFMSIVVSVIILAMLLPIVGLIDQLG